MTVKTTGAEWTNSLLRRFVESSRDGAEFMRTPFTRGEWVYATNGHIAVRVPRADGIEASEIDLFPRIEAIFKQNKWDTFVSLPSLPPADQCRTCNGSGIGYKCTECDGTGQFDHGRHTYDCDECDGTGQTDNGNDEEPCQVCDGTGELRYQKIQVGPWHYNRRYLAKIIDLPELQFAQRPDGPTINGSDGIANFTFEGGEGLLMPMRA